MRALAPVLAHTPTLESLQSLFLRQVWVRARIAFLKLATGYWQLSCPMVPLWYQILNFWGSVDYHQL